MKVFEMLNENAENARLDEINEANQQTQKENNMSNFKINTTTATTTAHDLESNKQKTDKPKFTETIAQAQIDKKAIMAEAYSQVKEEVDGQDSFIAEMDIGKDGLPKAWKEQSDAIEKIVTKESAKQEKVFLKCLNDNKTKDLPIMSTSWTSDNGKTTIRTKYFFDSTVGIIVKELKETPTRETYTVAIPSIRGLAGFRAEIKHNMELQNVEELIALHNNHVLLSEKIEPEQQIFYDLSEVREDETGSRFYARSGIFINFQDKLINSITNEKNEKPTAKKVQRDF